MPYYGTIGICLLVAAHLALAKKYEHKQSFATVTAAGAQGDLPHSACNLATEKELELHRGCRAFGPITVETYYTTGVHWGLSIFSGEVLTVISCKLKLSFGPVV